MKEKQNLEQLSSGWNEGEYDSDNLIDVLNRKIEEMSSGYIIVSSLVISGWDFPRRSQEHLVKFASLLLEPVTVEKTEYIPYFYRADKIKLRVNNLKDPVFTWYVINSKRHTSKEILDIYFERFDSLISSTEFFKIVDGGSDEKVVLSAKKGMVIYNRNSTRHIGGRSLIVKANKNAYEGKNPYIIT